jgi:hypothetical protein
MDTKRLNAINNYCLAVLCAALTAFAAVPTSAEEATSQALAQATPTVVAQAAVPPVNEIVQSPAKGGVTPNSNIPDQDSKKRYYTIPNFRIGGKYNLDADPETWRNGGEGGTTPTASGAFFPVATAAWYRWCRPLSVRSRSMAATGSSLPVCSALSAVATAGSTWPSSTFSSRRR